MVREITQNELDQALVISILNHKLRTTIKNCLSQGANPNFFYGQRTMLVLALENGYGEDTFAMLLQAGADPMVPSTVGGYTYDNTFDFIYRCFNTDKVFKLNTAYERTIGKPVPLYASSGGLDTTW